MWFLNGKSRANSRQLLLFWLAYHRFHMPFHRVQHGACFPHIACSRRWQLAIHTFFPFCDGQILRLNEIIVGCVHFQNYANFSWTQQFFTCTIRASRRAWVHASSSILVAKARRNSYLSGMRWRVHCCARSYPLKSRVRCDSTVWYSIPTTVQWLCTRKTTDSPQQHVREFV